MTRRERIVFLLENYLDVLQGIQDGAGLGDGDVLALMCRAWNHRSYRELEALRKRMRDEEPFTYWHLAETYFRCTFRRVKVCADPKCSAEAPPWTDAPFHKHGRRHVPFIPGITRVVSLAVNTDRVAEGIAWLDEHWHGEPFIPDDLMTRQEQAA